MSVDAEEIRENPLRSAMRQHRPFGLSLTRDDGESYFLDWIRKGFCSSRISLRLTPSGWLRGLQRIFADYLPSALTYGFITWVVADVHRNSERPAARRTLIFASLMWELSWEQRRTLNGDKWQPKIRNRHNI